MNGPELVAKVKEEAGLDVVGVEKIELNSRYFITFKSQPSQREISHLVKFLESELSDCKFIVLSNGIQVTLIK